MSVAITGETAIDEIDEALRHLSLVPENERGSAWHAYSDSLLEKRRGMDNQHD